MNDDLITLLNAPSIPMAEMQISALYCLRKIRPSEKSQQILKKYDDAFLASKFRQMNQ